MRRKFGRSGRVGGAGWLLGFHFRPSVEGGLPCAQNLCTAGGLLALGALGIPCPSPCGGRDSMRTISLRSGRVVGTGGFGDSMSMRPNFVRSGQVDCTGGFGDFISIPLWAAFHAHKICAQRAGGAGGFL